MTVASFTWAQVLAWRMRQQALLPRAGGGEMLEVVSRLGGVQAQLMPAAELALWARVEGIDSAQVQQALWKERSLLKTWVMRGTLHLIAGRDYPLFVAARQAIKINRPPSYYSYHGVTPEDMEAILAGIPQVLGETPMTREELANAVADWSGMPNLVEVLLSGWGALLKPSAFQGQLCFGPNQGQNVTFVQPKSWLGAGQKPPALQQYEPEAALREVVRRYLRAYGPATAEQFARWWGTQPGPAKRVFKSLGEEIETVGVDGRQAWALADTLKEMAEQAAPRSVQLLPLFDAYTLGIERDNDYVLPEQFRAKVYRPQGWISAVVLVDGRIAGVWEQEQQRGITTLKVESFQPLPGEAEAALQAEAQRLGAFLGSKVELAL